MCIVYLLLLRRFLASLRLLLASRFRLPWRGRCWYVYSMCRCNNNSSSVLSQQCWQAPLAIFKYRWQMRQLFLLGFPLLPGTIESVVVSHGSRARKLTMWLVDGFRRRYRSVCTQQIFMIFPDLRHLSDLVGAFGGDDLCIIYSRRIFFLAGGREGGAREYV